MPDELAVAPKRDDWTMQRPQLSTLVTCLHNACGGTYGITFLSSRTEQEFLSYAELRSHSLNLLSELTKQGVARGDEVVLQIRDDREFLVAFWACLLGRLIAVPLAVGTNHEHRRKVLAVWRRLNNPFLITDSEKTRASIANFPRDSGEKEWGTVAEAIEDRSFLIDDRSNVPTHSGEPQELPELPSPEEYALIQFSSGSTGEPKGVIVTHRGALVNTRDMIDRLEVTDRDRYLSWMPLTHDFGIIGMHLTPLVAGIAQVQIPTQLFVRSPMTWFHAVDTFRATVIASPNFGYRHFLKFFDPEAAAAWDLSSVRVLQNGAEPISPSLCHEFLDTLAPYALEPTSMLPGYGLAEATLAVSYALFDESVPTVRLDRNALGPGDRVIPLGPEDPSAVEFVDVGYPVASTQVRIVDERRGACDEETIGIIEIRGENVTPGYYNSPEASAATISPDGWLDTGDLGFIRGGRLVITGRAKDIIFSRGVNYYPHDIERVALELEDIDVNKIAVSGIQNGVPEQIAAFVYFKRSVEEFFPLARKLRAHILRSVGLHLDYIVPVTAIPKTTSGKVRRYALAKELVAGTFKESIDRLAELQKEEDARVSEETLSAMTESTTRSIRRQLQKIAEEIVGIPISNHRMAFVDYGFDSVRAVEFQNRLSTLYRLDLPVSLIFDYPDIASLGDAIEERLRLESNESVADGVRHSRSAEEREKIAVIGLGCRLPGNVNSLDDLVELLEESRDATTDPPAWRSIADRRGGYRDDVDLFDHTLFGISPKEAEWLDPQHRFLLETSWDAIENALVRPSRLQESTTGVFVGISSNGYGRRWEENGTELTQHSLTGTMLSTAAGRISYCLDLEGPSLALDTACSSSLAALHLALASLRSGECDYALAGGVNLILDRAGYEGLEQTGALSADGRCKAFGASADGYGRGEGCGMVLLRPLDDALREGDPIHAIILGSAMNHDGRSNGLTAPSGPAQERVIGMALRDAGCDPEQVGYVEAHGTGTELGDPQEINALAQVYGTSGRQNPLVVGTVKSNIGHLESGAGVAGLLKVIASLQHHKFFATLHANPPNPHIEWDQLPIHLPLLSEEWKSDQNSPRIAGLSSFGMSGTNLHILVAEHRPGSIDPEKAERSRVTGGLPEDFPVILPFSAADPESLQSRREDYRAYLQQHPLEVRRLAATAAQGRADLRFRGAVIGRDVEELLKNLASPVSPETSEANDGSTVWLFTGQGSQYVGMGAELYRTVEHVRTTINHVAELFGPFLGFSVAELFDGVGERSDQRDIDQTSLSQPAIFTLEYALASWLLSLGLKPDMVGGHSLGECAAAVVAGILPLEEGVRIVALRSRFMQNVSREGAMATFFCSSDQVRSLLDRFPQGLELSIAALNGPTSVVLSGASDDLEKVIGVAEEGGVTVQRLRVSHAFHSPLMVTASEEFREAVGQVVTHPARIPFVSSTRGRLLSERERLDCDYWTDQILAPVLFADLVEEIFSVGGSTILEVGPRPILCGLAGREPLPSGLTWVPTLDGTVDDATAVAQAIARLYTCGGTIDWKLIYPEGGDRSTPLPAYPWLRRRFWIDYPVSGEQTKTLPRSDSREEDSREEEMKREVGAEQRMSPEKTLQDVVAEMLVFVARRTGYEVSDISVDRDFFQMGFDSLVLMSVRGHITEHYGVELSPSVFYNHATITSIASIVADELATRPIASQATPLDDDPEVPTGNIADIIRRQIALMSEQLELLRSHGNSESVVMPTSLSPGVGGPVVAAETSTFTPYRGIDRGERSIRLEGGPKGAYLEDLIERYCRLTGASKKATATYRATFANNRNIAGFAPSWKELVYQLQVDRALGSRVYDIDGNEFIDLTMGFGVNLFGHNPTFIRTALEERLDIGISVGPMSPLAGPIAQRLARLTGVERTAFYNSGTEAVMVALRLARGATGREKVVIFSGSYHGTFDGVLALPGSYDKGHGSLPLAPGVTAGMVSDVIVLSYGTEESLDYIRDHGHELAAVLVEPVQSRRPDFQPREFLHEVRELTERTGTALIFDEVITGFRIHPGGAQHYFNITADIVVYGKVVGGGMPIGIVAGKRRFLDLVDGGYWSFGDASVPPSINTFVAGTFCHHPLAMAATDMVLQRMEERGEEICRELNEKTARFAESLNVFFIEQNLSLRVVCFGSLFRFVLGGDWELLYFALLTHGVYVWEGRNCFFSTEHSDDDIERVRSAVITSVTEMMRAGFAPEGIMPEGVRPDTERPILLPMSSVQRRLYAISADPEGERAYHINGLLRFASRFDHERAESSLRAIIARHEGLRTGFIVEDGELLQRIDAEAEFSLARRQVGQGMTIGDVMRESIHPFDLSAPPLLRAVAIEESDGTDSLFLDMHHIAGDGTTLEVIVREFLQEYEASLDCKEPPAPLSRVRPVQYREFVAWENAFVESDRFSRQEAFWEKILSIDTERLTLPLDFPRSDSTSHRGALLSHRVDLEPVAALARSHRSSVYMVMLALYSEFLRRIAGERSFRFGVVHAGRTDPRFARTVGMFANSLIMPVSIDPESGFCDLLQSIKERALEIFDNVDYPFEQLVRLDPEVVRDQRISLSYEEIRVDQSEVAEFVVTPDFQRETTTSDLNLNVISAGSDLWIEFNYSTDLFASETADRLSRFFLHLLDEIILDPTRPLADYTLVDDAERELICSNEVPGPPVESLTDFVDLFRTCVERTPDAPAIYADRSPEGLLDPDVVSYRELDHRSNGLATVLRDQHHVGSAQGATDIVAIYLERSVDFLVAILGILKAGGGFLAVEPSLPKRRVAYMLRDADVEVVVTSRVLAESLAESLAEQLPEGVTTVIAERVDPTPSFESEQRVLKGGSDPRNNPETIAYMVYTSGSTGEPKGVMVSRRNLANYAFWITRDRVENVGLNVFSLHISPAFDMMMSQIFPPLASGRAIWVHHPALPVDQVIERSFSIETPIDSVSLTPSHLSLLEDSEIRESNVRLVSIGGEVLAERHRDLVRALNPAIQLYNDYGPTEATVSCIAHLVNSDGRVEVIGRPMPNSIVYILDDTLHPCPVGIVGEICVGGAIVAIGYRNRDDLNATRFLEDPFRSGDRIYRTGDLGRLLSDGTIEFLGRKDRQIKLHGHRIEIGEIETVVGGVEGVRAVAVRLERDERGEFLAAWVVAPDRKSPEELRTDLCDVLPPYMIPSVIMSVESIPLSRSGKVDVQQLPSAVRSHEIVNLDEGSARSSFTRIENDVACVWEEFLDIRINTLDVNFFHVGGDSIKAIRIASRLRSKGYEVDSGSILKERTLGDLSRLIVEAGERAIVPAPEPTSVEGPLPLTPIQRWFFGLDLPDRNHWNQGVLLSLDRLIPIDIVREALALLVIRHDALRMLFSGVPTIDPVVRPARAVAADSSERDLIVREFVIPPDSTRDDVATLITGLHREINITSGPLITAGLLHASGEMIEGTGDLPSGRSLVALCVHHLAVDAVSWSIIIEEFLILCSALLRRASAELPPPSASFHRHAHGLMSRAESSEILAQIPYWRSIALEAASVGKLPVDRVIDRRDRDRMRRTVRSVGREMTSQLRSDGLVRFSTKTNELLTAILSIALREWTGAAKNLLTLEWHGRAESEALRLDRTIGWFTTTWPLVLDGSGDVEDVIVATKERMRAVPDNGAGYAILRELTPPEKREGLDDNLEPPILFNYLGDLQFNETRRNAELGEVNVLIEPPGEWIDRSAAQQQQIEIDLWIRDDSLHWSISWHSDEFLEETITRLCDLIDEATLQVVDCCRRIESRLTPSDLEYQGFDNVVELDRFLAANKIESNQIATIRPLVSMQEGMFFEAIRHDRGYSQRAQLDIAVRGDIDADRLEAACRNILERYDALRTGFTIEGWKEPLAVVYRSVEPDFRAIDMRAQGDKAAEEFVSADWRERFDYLRGPLLRIRLITVAEDHHRLILSTDHIIQDGWCIGLILNGLLDAYDRLKGGEPLSGLPSVPSYRAYIEWLRSYDRDGGIRFWEAYLEGFTKTTSIPCRENVETPNREVERSLRHDVLEFSVEEIEAITKGARSLGTTSNTLLRTAWALVLAHLSGHNDLVFGGVVSGRPPEIHRVDEIIGLFINTLPVRVRIDPEVSVADHVRAVAEDALACNTWHHNSITDFHRMTPLREKLFDHILVVENYPVDRELAEGLAGRDDFRFESFRFRGDESFDLVLTAMLEISREIRFSYNPEVYDAETIARVGRLLRRTLLRVSREPELEVTDVIELDVRPHSNGSRRRRATRSLKEIEARKIDL